MLAVFRISIDRNGEGGVYVILGRKLLPPDSVLLLRMGPSLDVAQHGAEPTSRGATDLRGSSVHEQAVATDSYGSASLCRKES